MSSGGRGCAALGDGVMPKSADLSPRRDSVALHEVSPREVTGRDVIARFQAQFRGAALASLGILEGKALDRVYCDFQEDFVSRELSGSSFKYHFVQVKTKGSAKHQWSRLELFGMPKRTPKNPKGMLAPGIEEYSVPELEQLQKMRSSFVGRLLEHTLTFGESCGSVTFQTNAFLDDEVEQIAQSFAAGERSERTYRYIADNFAAMFETAPVLMAQVHMNLAKLRFEPAQPHLDPHDSEFGSRALRAIWKFSEVDLTHTEGVELVQKLLGLVERKSSSKLLARIGAKDLEDAAGICLDDLLDLLPISRGAYYHFLSIGDERALKHASILQRKLGRAGATPDMIEAASRWKISWDAWVRRHRHVYEQEMGFLQFELNAVYGRWSRGEVSFLGLRDEVATLKSKLSANLLSCNLTDEILTGGVLAELVRGETR